MIPRLFHSPNLGAALVMGIRPIEADHFTPTAAMCPRDNRAMVGHRPVGCPASLKHGFVHGPPAAGCPRLPHLCIIESLQRFIRTQNQARHIPTDMVKALSTAKHLTIRSQTTADRLGHTNKRHHGYYPVSGGSHSRRRRMLLKINDLSHLAFVNIRSRESITYAFYAARMWQVL